MTFAAKLVFGCLLLIGIGCDSDSEKQQPAAPISVQIVQGVVRSVTRHEHWLDADFYIVIIEEDDNHQVVTLKLFQEQEPPVWIGLHCVIKYQHNYDDEIVSVVSLRNPIEPLP